MKINLRLGEPFDVHSEKIKVIHENIIWKITCFLEICKSSVGNIFYRFDFTNRFVAWLPFPICTEHFQIFIHDLMDNVKRIRSNSVQIMRSGGKLGEI